MSPTAHYLPLAIALLLILPACGAATPSPSPSSAQPEPPRLVGRAFLSTGVTENGTQRDLVRDTRIRLDFDNGRLGASAGCNLLGGDYAIADDRLLVGPMHTTDMGCDPARHAQDEWLTGFLGARPTVALDGMTLMLEADDTRITLADRRVVDPDLELTGPLWVLDTVIDGDAASSVPVGVVASLRFDDGGRVDVDTGCNTGGGEYDMGNGQITFAQIGLTRIACPGVAGDVERIMLEVLAAPDLGYRIEADRLLLDAGGLVLGFRADG